MKQGNVPPSNVFTINSLKDFPHWSDSEASFSGMFNTLTLSSPIPGLAGNFIMNASRFWHDYDNNREVGTHLFLDGPSASDIDLGHGGMMEGLWNDTGYNMILNGRTRIEKTTLSSLINYFIQLEPGKGVIINEKN